MKYNDTVILAGAGPISEETFQLVQNYAHIFVGVDGGADSLLARGLMPDAVVGDMDSLSDAGRAALDPDRIIAIAEQETTDFEKALRTVEAPMILAIGFTGARLDHELAALHALLRFEDRAILVVGEQDVTVHLPRSLTLDLPVGQRLSLFPMEPVSASAAGLQWGFENLAFHPAGRIGTSNAVASRPVHLQTDGRGLLLIVPSEALGALIDAIERADFPLAPPEALR